MKKKTLRLRKEEWFFARLPEHHVEDCWVYEFCRESEVVRQLHKQDMALLEDNPTRLVPFGMLITDFRGFFTDGFWWLHLDDKIRLTTKAGFPNVPYQVELKTPPKVEQQPSVISNEEAFELIKHFGFNKRWVEVDLFAPKKKSGTKPGSNTSQTLLADLKALGALRLKKHLKVNECITHAIGQGLEFYEEVHAVYKALKRARKIVDRFDQMASKKVS